MKDHDEGAMILYTEDGDPVQVLGRDEDGKRVIRDSYGTVTTLTICPADTLYASPDAGLKATIQDLKSKKATLIEDVDLLVAEMSRARERREEQVAELARLNPALAKIESFLRGEFTHFAFIPEYGSVRVRTRKEALKADDAGRLRMVSLSGNTTSGRLTWEINEYRDGSGQDTTVVPCGSEEEARSVVKGEITERLKGDDWRHWLTEADRFGVEVPDDKRVRRAGETLKAAEEEYLATQAQDARALAKLEEARCVIACEVGSQP